MKRALVLVALVTGCSSSSSSSGSKAPPVIDDLQMPASAMAAADGTYTIAGTISFHDDAENVVELHVHTQTSDIKVSGFGAPKGTAVPIQVKFAGTKGATLSYSVSILGESGAESAARTEMVTLQ